MTPEQCVETFNPLKEEDYYTTVENWTDAILELTG